MSSSRLPRLASLILSSFVLLTGGSVDFLTSVLIWNDINFHTGSGATRIGTGPADFFLLTHMASSTEILVGNRYNTCDRKLLNEPIQNGRIS